MTGDLAMGSNRITGLADATQPTDAVNRQTGDARYQLQSSGVLPTGHIFGLTLSNNAIDATNDIDIAVGKARDSTDAADLALASGMTKRLDAAWAAGTGNGGLDSGVKASSTTYHLWLILKDSDGSADVLFSTSASAPTMPSGYTNKRRIGAILTGGSGAIIAFLQTGDRFELKTPVQDVSGAAASSAPTARTLTVPSGIKVSAILTISATSTNAGNTLVYDPDLGTLNASSVNRTLVNAAGASASNTKEVMTSTGGQVRTSGDGTSATVTLGTFGWIDRRGRDA